MRLAGVDVARIGLGTNRLTKTPENIAFVRAAVDAGLQLIDTARLYTGGQSEDAIGAALSPMPERCVVATKGGFHGGRPAVLHAEIDESLKKLKVESIRLYYLHRVDPETPIEVSLGAIKEHVDRGQIRHVGVSQVELEDIERARQVIPIAAVQNMYNLSERKHDDVVDYCEREGIAFVPFYPLHGENSPALLDIAQRHGATPNQVKLAWLLKRSPVTLPIPGTLSLDHLRENLAALRIELTDRDFEALR